MVAEAGISGAEKLNEVGRRFETAAAGFGEEVVVGMRVVAERTLSAIRRSAGSSLPHGGGLADRVAGQKFAVRAEMIAGRPTVKITGSGMRSLADIDRGQVTHPVFDPDVWVEQSVAPGFFTKPAQASEPLVRVEIQHVMSETASKIERSL